MKIIIITAVAIVSALLILVSFRLCKQTKCGKPSFGILLAVIFLSALSYSTRGWMVPGGPFVSIHAEALPILSCLTVMVVAVRKLRHFSIVGRIGLYVIAMAAAGIAGVMLAGIVSFWREYYPRGEIFGW